MNNYKLKTTGLVLVLALFAISTAALAANLSGKEMALMEKLRSELQSFKSDLARLKAEAPSQNRDRGIALFENEIQIAEKKLAELENKSRGVTPMPAESLSINRNLRQGSSGEDVRRLQDFLKQFPDIYPEGLATGYFGKLSEKAVKKLQEKFDLEQVGQVGPKTRLKLGELFASLGRKQRPHISAVSPDSLFIGETVTLTGSGFTFEDNALFVHGKIVLKNLASADGGEISFAIPTNITCVPDQACPIKIVNKNGISNAKPFKLTYPPMPPEPDPIPPPPPPPPPTPQITSIFPSYGQLGTAVTLTGSGFSATNNSVNFGGLAGAVTGIASSDGQTLKFNVPSSPCKPLESCSVSVTNSGGTSNITTFTLAQPITPVAIAKPNGGEKFLQGSGNIISWTGGTDAVQLALTESSAVNSKDVSPLIVGWIYNPTAAPNSSMTWNANEACASASSGNCWPVAPDNYKILAVSENELGQVAIGIDGSGNWDVSDQAFSVLPAPQITVVSPNGGEKLTYGSDATIIWNATSILSQAVKINLLKNGVFYRAISGSAGQGAPDGSFFLSWTVPSDIPAAGDYTIEIMDTQNAGVRDVSDSAFTIAPKASITVVAPNGGERWFKGFQATVRWSSGNILSKSVNINLLKGGVFARRLASGVPQKFYSWETQSYVSGSGFNYALAIPSDLTDGSDYTLEITDSADLSTSDVSNSAFSVLSVPSPVTFSGRIVNKFTSSPLANTQMGTLDFPGGGWVSFKSGPNGEFSISTTTAEMSSTRFWKMPVASWPTCYMLWQQLLYWRTDSIYHHDHLFDLLRDTIVPLVKSDVNFGDVPMWPGTGLYTYADKPNVSSAMVSYPDSSYGGWQILALEADLQVKLYDFTAGVYYTAPSIKIPLANGCTPKTLTYLNGAFKWEPYNIRSSYGISGATFAVGTPINKVTFSAAGGVAPYTWGLYYGPLPPGLTLDPATGVLSGTPTTAGTYKFQIKITDANGINGGSWPITVTVK